MKNAGRLLPHVEGILVNVGEEIILALPIKVWIVKAEDGNIVRNRDSVLTAKII